MPLSEIVVSAFAGGIAAVTGGLIGAVAILSPPPAVATVTDGAAAEALDLPTSPPVPLPTGSQRAGGHAARSAAAVVLSAPLCLKRTLTARMTG